MRLRRSKTLPALPRYRPTYLESRHAQHGTSIRVAFCSEWMQVTLPPGRLYALLGKSGYRMSVTVVCFKLMHSALAHGRSRGGEDPRHDYFRHRCRLAGFLSARTATGANHFQSPCVATVKLTSYACTPEENNRAMFMGGGFPRRWVPPTNAMHSHHCGSNVRYRSCSLRLCTPKVSSVASLFFLFHLTEVLTSLHHQGCSFYLL